NYGAIMASQKIKAFATTKPKSFLSRSSITARTEGRERLMFRVIACVPFVLLLTATSLTAQEAAETAERASTATKGEASRQVQQSVCLLVESAAYANGLPVGFFVRLIWQVGRFKAPSVGQLSR